MIKGEDKFLDLSHYKGRENYFIHHMKPKVDPRRGGVITHYLKRAESNYGRKIFETFHDSKDKRLLKELILKHGIFFEKFFIKQLRLRVYTFLNSEKHTTELISLCKKYHGKEFSDKTVKSVITNDFVNVSLNNLKSQFLYKKLLRSVKTFSATRICEICGNHYEVIDFPDWLYYRTNGNISVCYECPVKDKISKPEMIPLIKELVEECGFIPNADFSPINNNFSSRIPSEKWNRICQIIFDLGIVGNIHGSNEIINTKFGTWFKALIESNVLPDGTMITSRGVKCLAKSGNECLSLDEMYIDNWLFERNIKTEKEPHYPQHPIYNKSGRRRADWKINEFYIEYFGLKGEEYYDKITNEKIELTKALNLKLIPIYPSDLNNLKEKFEPLTKGNSYNRFNVSRFHYLNSSIISSNSMFQYYIISLGDLAIQNCTNVLVAIIFLSKSLNN